jgi:hypothetical protein
MRWLAVARGMPPPPEAAGLLPRLPRSPSTGTIEIRPGSDADGWSESTSGRASPGRSEDLASTTAGACYHSVVREVVGRDRELAEIKSFFDLEAGAADVLLIEGEAGIGKTTLWRAAVEEARERGYRVLSCAGAEAEAQLSFTAFRDLLGAAFGRCMRNARPCSRRRLYATAVRPTSVIATVASMSGRR